MLKDSQVDLCGRTDFTRTAPLLARDEAFSFACAGCGGCCRGREDIVLSGFDLWRIAARLRLPPRTVARAFCRGSIGRVSRLPVLRLAPLKEERGNCPFLTGNHCAIHDAEPLVCALYPLAQEITKDGQVSYFLQPTQCGGQVIAARVGDYLARYDVPAREATDVRWAQQAIAQSETFLKQFGLPATAMPNTAMAAKFVAESGDRTKAAIASVETAALYGLEVLVPSINTDGDNTTRFIVLSREKPTVGNRFSLLFTLDNKPGKLAEVIQVIGRFGYDMESIKSRPLPHVPFDYYFYVELVGDPSADETAALLRELDHTCRTVRLLGVYTK